MHQQHWGSVKQSAHGHTESEVKENGQNGSAVTDDTAALVQQQQHSVKQWAHGVITSTFADSSGAVCSSSRYMESQSHATAAAQHAAVGTRRTILCNSSNAAVQQAAHRFPQRHLARQAASITLMHCQTVLELNGPACSPVFVAVAPLPLPQQSAVCFALAELAAF